MVPKDPRAEAIVQAAAQLRLAPKGRVSLTPRIQVCACAPREARTGSVPEKRQIHRPSRRILGGNRSECHHGPRRQAGKESISGPKIPTPPLPTPKFSKKLSTSLPYKGNEKEHLPGIKWSFKAASVGINRLTLMDLLINGAKVPNSSFQDSANFPFNKSSWSNSARI